MQVEDKCLSPQCKISFDLEDVRPLRGVLSLIVVVQRKVLTPSSLSSNTFPIRRNVRLVLLSECDELLLMKIALPDRSFWCTIGGGIEAQETPEQAVYREASEEIGLNQAALSLTRYTQVYQSRRGTENPLTFNDLPAPL